MKTKKSSRSKKSFKAKSSKTNLSQEQLLRNPYLNKGTAFTAKERAIFGLEGKLPHQIETLDIQAERAYQQYQKQPSNSLKHIFLHQLNATNQTLFYKFAKTHLSEILPILYTPNVANAVINFSHEFQKPYPQSLYISYAERNKIKQILNAYNSNQIDLIVVTDGEGVLGIGDQGIGGIHIPIAKSMLYTLFGGINPTRILSIALDVGTNNQTLLHDPLYLGWQHERLSETKYLDFIDAFVNAVSKEFPQALLHWEDFSREHASLLLYHYRDKVCSFNDDIQGTAVVTMAALLAALKSKKQSFKEQCIVIFGAGTAGIGIAEQIVSFMQQTLNMPQKEALSKIWLIDKQGLLTNNSKGITKEQKPFLRDHAEIANWKLKENNFISLSDTVNNLYPTILIGCSTKAGAFTEEIIRNMAMHTEKPIIFPLSNPTDKCEAMPENILNWTNGKALIATGSPFAPVIYNGKTIPITQCNNALVFPGIGLGAITAKAKKLTDAMLQKACEELLKTSPMLNTQNNTQSAALLPPLADAAGIAPKIARAIALEAYQAKLSNVGNIADKKNISKIIKEQMWTPRY